MVLAFWDGFSCFRVRWKLGNFIACIYFQFWGVGGVVDLVVQVWVGCGFLVHGGLAEGDCINPVDFMNCGVGV